MPWLELPEVPGLLDGVHIFFEICDVVDSPFGGKGKSGRPVKCICGWLIGTALANLWFKLLPLKREHACVKGLLGFSTVKSQKKSLLTELINR